MTQDQGPYTLQEGIYVHREEERGRHYRLLLINVQEGAGRYEARAALARVWQMLQDLRRGIVRELRPTRDLDPPDAELTVPSSGLVCLLGFGARLFSNDRHRPLLADALPRDGGLVELRPLDRSGTGVPYPSLPWAADSDGCTAEADIALQFTAETELAVNRAVVEVWKLVEDEQLPLTVMTFYGGCSREDKRSWLGFHDCVSNLESEGDRRAAVEVVDDDASWMLGGSYMAFLRLGIDLKVWRSLRREHQELIVGRDKLSGCPLVGVDTGRYGELIPVPARTSRDALDYLDPPRPSHPLLQASHIHRANINRTAPTDADSNRILRQPYEFLEPLTSGGFRAGLNFVSFQRRLSYLATILSAQVWLGEVNFGGPHALTAGLASVPLLSVVAGGYYAVPPAGEPFPGASIF